MLLYAIKGFCLPGNYHPFLFCFNCSDDNLSFMSSRKENLADTDSDRLNIIFDRTLETENDSKDESGVKMFTFDEGDLY